MLTAILLVVLICTVWHLLGCINEELINLREDFYAVWSPDDGDYRQ
jgi:hypothetical protein